MLFINRAVELGTIGPQHVIGKCPQRVVRHAAVLPHQQVNEEICDDQDNRKLVGTVEDRLREPHCFPIDDRAGALRRIRVGNGRSANCALRLPGAHNCPTAATEGRPVAVCVCRVVGQGLNTNKRDASDNSITLKSCETNSNCKNSTLRYTKEVTQGVACLSVTDPGVTGRSKTATAAGSTLGN